MELSRLAVRVKVLHGHDSLAKAAEAVASAPFGAAPVIEDGVFVGQCPGVIGPCCHGPDEVEVYRELCGIVEEWLEIATQDGITSPAPTAGQGAAQKIAPSCHRQEKENV